MERTFIVLTAMVHGELKTALVEAEEFEGDAADYFPSGSEDIEEHGEIDVSGDASDMLPSSIVEG